MGSAQLWFGTDGPGFYERLGSVQHRCKRRDFRIMRLPLGDSAQAGDQPAAEPLVDR